MTTRNTSSDIVNKLVQRKEEIESAIREVRAGLSVGNCEHAEDWLAVVEERVKRLVVLVIDHHACRDMIPGDTCTICQPLHGSEWL